MSDTRHWHKSTYSGGSGASCVEVAEGVTTLVRDSQNPDRAPLAMEAGAWTRFLRAVKAGELDD